MLIDFSKRDGTCFDDLKIVATIPTIITDAFDPGAGITKVERLNCFYAQTKLMEWADLFENAFIYFLAKGFSPISVFILIKLAAGCSLIIAVQT